MLQLLSWCPEASIKEEVSWQKPDSSIVKFDAFILVREMTSAASNVKTLKKQGMVNIFFTYFSPTASVNLKIESNDLFLQGWLNK